jgi:uncharacterized protein (TIGR02271 family)
MNQNIVSAVFDSHSEAEAAVRELRQRGVRDNALSVIARHDSAGGDYGGANTHEAKEKGEGLLKGALAGGGIGALLGIAALAIPGVGPLAAAGAIAASAVPEAAAIGAGAGALAGGLGGLLKKHGVSDEDAGYYEEQIHKGGVFVSVDTSDSAISPDEARNILRGSGGHSSGFARNAPGAATGTASGTSFAAASTTGAGQAVQEERIPIVEEELQIGKREVNRGGVAVHSRVVEQPVHEQVSLREEHVSVERRPVNERVQSAAAGGELFQERTVEMTETAEEAVIAKEARVREELVVRKTAEERTESIDETIRTTEVEVEEGAQRSGSTSAFGFNEQRSDKKGL